MVMIPLRVAKSLRMWSILVEVWQLILLNTEM